jgi:hypothetical protein
MKVITRMIIIVIIIIIIIIIKRKHGNFHVPYEELVDIEVILLAKIWKH